MLLLLDNYDSFTYNVYQLLSELGADVEVELLALLDPARDAFIDAVAPYAPDADRHRSDLRASAPCYYDLSNGIVVSDEAFAALLGRPIPPRERQQGEPHTLNATLEEAQDSIAGRMLVSVGRRIATRMSGSDEVGSDIVEHVLFTSPVRMMSMEGGGIPPRVVEGLVLMLNRRFFRGLWHMITKLSS